MTTLKATSAAPRFLISVLLTLLSLITLFPAAAEAKSYYVHASSSLLGLIVLVLDLVAVFEVLNSPRATMAKVGWILFIFFFPILGLIIYYFFGRKTGTQYEVIGA
ncbi:hypothetical protein DFJ77DRAFT_508990 [Powellomyces hirtus]|nr:hypothetical protein DFJ77DRAFT_508990 [Powellomyces hirtus]